MPMSIGPAELVASLEWYDALITAIARECGQEDEKYEPGDAPLVALEVLKPFSITGMSRDFLSRARKLAFIFIAPGLKTWSSVAFAKVMEVDAATGYRHRALNVGYG